MTVEKSRICVLGTIASDEQTRYSCFLSDLTEYHVTNSVLALVDGEPWPLHRPLVHSCSLTLLTFKDSDPTVVNEVPVEIRFHFKTELLINNCVAPVYRIVFFVR